MNKVEAQALAQIIRSEADWLNVSVKHASEVYNLVLPESDEYVCWIEGHKPDGGTWSGDIESLQEWLRFMQETFPSGENIADN